jgi:dephospho-CoA kinase
MMDASDFIAVASRLRELGAIRVVADGFAVQFAHPAASSTEPIELRRRHEVADTPEAARAQLLREIVDV